MALMSVCYLQVKGLRLMQRTRDECFQLGVWNGPGGKKEPEDDAELEDKVAQEDEGFTRCILREFPAETGLELIDPVMRGKIFASFPDGKENIIAVYTASLYRGTLIPRGREGPLYWVAQGALPSLRRWSSDLEIDRLLAEGKVFEHHVRYGQDREVLESHTAYPEAA